MIITALMIFSCGDSTAEVQDIQSFTNLSGEYLGQTPPDKSPEIFAQGVISVDANFEHSAAVFSPDKNEVFWCTNVDWYTDQGISGNLRLYTMKIVNGKWTAPQPARFTKNIRVERPVFSTDGNKLYFECFRAVH